jgi:hypothetical protein
MFTGTGIITAITTHIGIITMIGRIHVMASGRMPHGRTTGIHPTGTVGIRSAPVTRTRAKNESSLI